MSPSHARPGFWLSALLVLQKDLLIEWRSRARLNALVFFALSTLLLFSFALGADTRILGRSAGGYLWLAIMFASVLALGESFRVENENGALDGLRLLPVDPRAIFVGKATGNAALLMVVAVVLVPVTLAVYDVRPLEGLPRLGGVLALGCLGISAPGTMYAAITSRSRAKDVLLPLLLFPILIPALIACSKAATLVLHGDAMQELRSWTGLLLGFNAAYWSLGILLFPSIIED
ncbi:MAG TPA: heme exporter protein CcmB [Myxococcaceae bacterium]|nr:heme exporter protein CcmB [Myxococcaceae bacterium]